MKRTDLDDGAGEDIGDDLQQVRSFSAPKGEGPDEETSDRAQVAGGHLQRQQHQHREPVEEVVHGGASKCPQHRTETVVKETG